MKKQKQKYYVVWNGLTPGVYDNWTDCLQQVKGVKQALYKSFESKEAADEAYANGYEPTSKATTHRPILSTNRPPEPYLCVDASCLGNPGKMEYQGVYLPGGKQIFHQGPFEKGSNNIGEFLAIVHALALLDKKGITNLPIYSDSVNAINWVRNKKCRTKLERVPVNEPIFDLIERAERWLATHTYTTAVNKWNTKEWGEIPADFGRK